MRVLGIGAKADSGAAVVADGRILAAINEERLSRLKLVVGFPRSAIREALSISATDVSELDAVEIWGGRERDQEIFATALYHALQMPTLFSGAQTRAAG